MAEQGIRVAVGQFNELTEEKLRFASRAPFRQPPPGEWPIPNDRKPRYDR